MKDLDLNNIIAIIIIALLLVILFKIYKKKENFNTPYQTIINDYDNPKNIITMNNLNATGNLNFNGLKGIIAAWYGSITSIPSGWKICDGTTYTALDGSTLVSPDLRDKFIVGASNINVSVIGFGGWGPTGNPNIPLSENNKLDLIARPVGETGGEITHLLLTDELPAHTHNIKIMVSGGGYIEPSDGQSPPAPSTSGITGGNQPHNNMPPYYSLIYIIKL